MRKVIFPLMFSVLVVGCAHHPKPQQAEFTYPWQKVANGVSVLVDQHAERAAFNKFTESSQPPRQLRTFAEIEKLTMGRPCTAAERAERRKWFRSTASVWHYSFECQFSGILFMDASGRVQHAILYG